MSRSATLNDILDEQGAAWVEWRGARVVDAFGDVEDEYRAVRDDGLGLIDRSEREVVVCNGDEVVPIIQGLVTSDVFRLAAEGAGQRSCAVNTKGRLIGDMRFLHVPDLLLVDLEPGQIADGLVAQLRGGVINEDARFTDRTRRTSRFGLYGSRAADRLDGLASLEHDLGAIEPWSGTWGRLGDAEIIVQRTAWLDVPGFEIACAVEDGTAVWRAMRESGATPFGNATFEKLRIEAGMPRWGVELDGAIIPLEAGFDDAIDYDKGCYLGQEIIARIDTLGTPAKMLRTLVVEGDEVPEVGAEIHDGEKRVGEVASATYSPVREAPIALGYVKRNHNQAGHELRIGEAGAIVEG